MAVLFALDRRAAGDELRAALAESDVLLVDRYLASNAAYGAARLHQSGDGEFVSWVRELELERFGIPAPDLQLLLRVRPRWPPSGRPAGRRWTRRAPGTATSPTTSSSAAAGGSTTSWPRSAG